jgi:hypothetical protein
MLALSFNKKQKINNSTLNENIVKIFSESKKFECKPSRAFQLQVETDITKRIRGAYNINAKIFIIEISTGDKKLVSQENLQVKKFEGSIISEENKTNKKTSKLPNGDLILGGSDQTPCEFNNLIKYDAVYYSYINATNKLLNLKRSI